MDAYHVLSEDEGSFLVHQNGSQFRVAKKGLGEALQSRLRARSVRHMDTGGNVSQAPDLVSELSDGASVDPSAPRSEQSTPMWIQERLKANYEKKRQRVHSIQHMAFGGDQSDVLSELSPQVTADPAAAAWKPPLDPAYYPAPELTPGNAYAFQAGGAPAAAQATAEHEAATQPGPSMADGQEMVSLPKQPSPDQASAAPRVAPSSIGSGSAYKIPGVYDDAAKTERDAIGEKRDAEIAKAEAQQTMLDKQAANEQDIETKRVDWHKKNDAQIDGLNSWLADPKNQVDAHKWWSNKSVPQKITAGISLILGGFAAGLTKGRNPAIDAIDQQIQQDIDSQKENINNKKSLVASFVNQGHSVDSASEMARAALLSVTKANLVAQANRFTKPEQQAAAKQALADIDLRIQAAKQGAAATQAQIDHSRAATRLTNARATAAGQPAAPVVDKAAVNDFTESNKSKSTLLKGADAYDDYTRWNTEDTRQHEVDRQEDKAAWISAMMQGKPGPKAAMWAQHYDEMIPPLSRLNVHITADEVRRRRAQMQKQAMALGLAGANARANQKSKSGARAESDEEAEE